MNTLHRGTNDVAFGVMDLETIRSGIIETDDETRMRLESIRELRISYKNLKECLNLNAFVLLEKLSLDHNNISNIDSMLESGSIPNIRSIDLSFNYIEEIHVKPGSLTKLVDLSLYANRLSSLRGFSVESENEGVLPNLEVLSVGKNQLSCIQELRHLINLPKLVALNTLDNPFPCNVDSPDVHDLLPRLVYFVYNKISPE